MADLPTPHDLDAERAVLGAVLIEPDRLVEAAAVVAGGDFFRLAHRLVWRAFESLHSAGTPIDFLTVRTALEAAKHLDEVTPLYLAGLTDGVPKAVNVAAYAGLVRDKARARAVLAELDRTQKAVTAHGATPEVLAGLSGALADASCRDTSLVLTDVGALLAEGDTTIEWLVEDRFAVGSINLLAGRPKAGKSTLARALGLAVARGDRWLGSRCRFGHVVYVPLEDKRSEVRRHYQRMGTTANEPIRFVFDANPQTLLADLSARLAAGDRIDLLIIDTAQRLLGIKDTNDYAMVTAALVPILALARTHGICIVLLHHAGKADRAGLESVLGSTAWAASVDNVLILNRTDRYRLVSSVQRIGPDLDETVVLMDEDTGDVRLGGSRYLVDLQTIAAAMRDAIAAAGENGIRRDDLLADVEARRELKLRALRALADEPTVERLGAGTKTDPHRYRLRPEPATAVPRTASTDSDSGSRVPYRDGNPNPVLVFPATTGQNDGPDCGSGERAGSQGSQNGGHRVVTI